ncbi:MAG: DUF1737 domain-containing protein [Pyrinomonadaceae bacterium]
MQYRILMDISASGLSERIQKAIDSDWKLQGGVAIALAGKNVLFAQAITNEQDEPEPVPIDRRSLLEMLEDALTTDEHPG